MKININIEATPQEIRSFFGLPDVEPLQKEMIKLMQKNMSTSVEGLDPVAMMQPFLHPEQSPALTTLQKTFWQTMMGNVAKTPEKEDKS